jgi:putative intracellular protease/amidase
MTDINRRKAPLEPYAVLAAVEQPQGPQHKMPDAPSVHWTGDEQIAMLMYPGMTVMDLIGPQSMFGALMGAKVFLVARSPDPVTSDGGVTITPTATFKTCPRDLTVLFTPGGTDGTLAAAKDPETLAFMADRGARAKYITSVCSGSLILGAAGLLNGYKATSHWSVRHVLAGFGAIPTDARVVRDRNRVTGAGVTAGLDFGLTMVAELRDRTYAECCQLRSEYDPDPPFHAGSIKTAPAEVKTHMVEMLADFVKKSEALAAAYRGLRLGPTQPGRLGRIPTPMDAFRQGQSLHK